MRHSRAASSLGSQASRALGWSFASNLTSRLGTLGIGVVLARLLGPHAFGTYAVAYVAMVAVLSFNELGVSLAIVRWEGEPAEIAPTVATISLVTSLLIYAGCFLGAPAFASAMGAPAATEVIRLLALNVIVDGVTTTPAALMQRYFRQDRKMIADQVNCWLGAIVSVTLAWQGMGAMSLAIGRMTGALASGVLFTAFSPVRFGFDAARARALFRFGLPLAGSSLIVFAVGNVDQLVVGHLLGPTALGLYALAFNLASWPVSMFSIPVRAVAPAVFSRLQHDRAAMRTGFLSAAGILGSVTLPVCLLICGSAAPLLTFAYGPEWVPAAHALTWLALLGALRILFELVYDFFVVLARSRVVFTVQLVWLVALVPALIAGSRAGGIAGAGLAEAAVAACVVLPWYLAELSRVGISRRALAGRLWLPLLTAAGVGAAAAAAARIIPVSLVALAAGGAAALAAIGLLGYRLRPVIDALRPVLGAGQAATPANAATTPAKPATPANAATPGLALACPTPAGATPDGARPAGATLAEAALAEEASAEAALAEAAAAIDAAAALPPGPGGLADSGPWHVPIAWPDARDITGPLPSCRDSTGPRPACRDQAGPLAGLAAGPHVTGPLPVYQATTAALSWDPARARQPAPDLAAPRGRHAR